MKDVSDRMTFLAGLLLGLVGLGLLAHLDFPVMARGGWPGRFAGAELFIATAVLSAAFGLQPGGAKKDDAAE